MSVYDDLKAWGDCGDAAEAYHANNCTSHEQAWDWLVASDKHEWLLWLALNSPVVPRVEIAAFLDAIVERAIQRALAVYTEPTFVTWAHKWLSGEDRTEAASAATARTAWAEDVAWSAAHAAACSSASARAETAWAWAAGAAGAAGDEARASEIRQQADWWRKQPNPWSEHGK